MMCERCNATLAALPPEGEVERLRAENARLEAVIEESQGDLDQLESDIGEYLPAYLLDEDDVANYRERVEYAGRDLKMLEAEVSQLRARVAELETLGRCDHLLNQCAVGRMTALEAQLAASQAALRKYGRHLSLRWLTRDGQGGPLPACPKYHRDDRMGDTCTCGLDAALQSLPERPAGGE